MTDGHDSARPESTPRREQTRQRLLDAAALVFAEVGLDAASVEAICERAGFTRGAFYSNFDTKEELVLALVERMSEAKLQQASDRMRETPTTDAPEEPADLVRRVLDVTTDHPVDIFLASEIRTRAMRDRRLGQAYVAWQRGMVARVAAIIGEAARIHGFVPRLPADELAAIILQLWEGTTVDGIIAGADHDEVHTIVRERTARLATALVDPA